MGKRFWSLVLSTALIGGVFSALPARAQEAPPATVPAVVNIEDAMADANYINDQGVGAPLPGDTVLPASAGTVSDILKAWFTSDAATISAHILTKAAPPASTPLIFHVRVDPGTGTECLWFRASFPSIVQGQEDPVVAKGASLRDTCPTALGVQAGELKVEKTVDANGVITMTFPRSIHPAFAEGNILRAPTADSRNFPGGVLTAPQIDDTKPGTDFIVTSGDLVVDEGTPAEPKPTPPGKNDPPGKKKGCPKGKGVKKGCTKSRKPKPPAASSCPAYVPGEEGAEAETTVVTAAATEDKPVEVTITAPPGVPEVALGHVFQNIQVDSAAPEAGLYVSYEFPVYEDHDIYLNYAGGSEAAHAGGFNQAPVGPLDGTGSGGHSEQGAEFLDGIRTPDCGGYTLDMAAFASEGGEMTLKLWLGESQNDPAAPEMLNQRSAADMFFDMMQLRNPLAPAVARSAAARKKKPKVCAPFAPGEMGAEQPSVVVTAAHTAEAPLIHTISLDPAADEGLLGDTPTATVNVQVDSASASAGLYVTWKFQSHRDYDLWAYTADGGEAASAHGFQPLMDTKGAPGPADQSNTASNHGGESTADSENLVGIITPDCGGYTVQFSNYLGEGGDFDVELWLGDGVTAPGVPAA